MTKRNELYGTDAQGKKLSEKMREQIFSVLDAPDKEDIQLFILDNTFNGLADEIPKLVKASFQNLYHTAERYSEPDEKTKVILTALTKGTVDLTSAFKVALNTKYTNYDEADIRQLPGYKKLHEVAREMDVAVNLGGFSKDEKRRPATMTIDISKTYEEGRLDSKYNYPDPEGDAEEEAPSPVAAAPVFRNTAKKHFKL